MKFTIALVAFLMGATSFAQIPTGYFSGSISNNSMREFCRLTRATVQFSDMNNGSYQAQWLEEGFAQGPRGGGFCESRLDSTFTPTRTANEWSVNFFWHNDIIFAKAVLQGDTLVITGRFSSSRDLQSFTAKMKFSSDSKTLNYNRVLNTWSGPSLSANGTLYNR